MKRIIPVIAFLCLTACSSEPAPTPKSTDTAYDAELARALGADDYGMRSYVFVTLKTGPKDAEITDATERGALFEGHFANMGRLAEEGKLVLAGPFMEAAPKRGLYIFDVPEITDAQALVETDPAVAAGIFIAEYDKYYGSAALKQINDIHVRIQKTKIE